MADAATDAACDEPTDVSPSAAPAIRVDEESAPSAPTSTHTLTEPPEPPPSSKRAQSRTSTIQIKKRAGESLHILLTEALFTGEVVVISVPEEPTSQLARGDVILFCNGYEAIGAQETAEQIREADDLMLIVRPAAKGGLVEKLGVDVATAWASSAWRVAFLAIGVCVAFFLMPLAVGAVSYQSEAAGTRREIDNLRRSSKSMIYRYNATTNLLQKRLRTDGQRLDAALKRIHAMEADDTALRQSRDALATNHTALRHSHATLNAEVARLRAELSGQINKTSAMQRQFAMESATLRQKASEEDKKLASTSTELDDARAASARKQRAIGHHREHEEHLSATLNELLELEELFKAKMSAARGEISHVAAISPPSPPPARPPPARASPPPPRPLAKFTGFGNTNRGKAQPLKPWERAVAEERQARVAAAVAKQKAASAAAPVGRRARSRRH